jgi:SNF2 family DNA or RNA helicase
MTEYVYKTTPFKHQEQAFLLSRDRDSFALFMEQGTGKTKVAIDTACWLFGKGEIDLLIVIAPNGVHTNWVVNEIPTHAPEHYCVQAAIYRSSMTKAEEAKINAVLNSKFGLKVLAFNIEALATKKGQTIIGNLVNSMRSMIVVDESTIIKNHKAIRTKALLKIAKQARYRRILTGTPVTQGPLDVFSQFQFLDPYILQTQSYYAFRGRYAVMKEVKSNGRTFQTVQSYVNLDELQSLISPHSFRVTKDECLDLPEKVYTKLYVELSPSQKRIYTDLKKSIIAEFNGKFMSATMGLTKILRLQQIVGGFFVQDQELVDLDIDFDQLGDMPEAPQIVHRPEPIDLVNSRVQSLMDFLEDTQGKVIIWARFRAEIESIALAIGQKYGFQSIVEYHGGVDPSTRVLNIEKFQKDPAVKYFIGHVQAGGKGLTLHAANTVIYYSNDFSLENRLQSEDRAHRIGQTKSVLYVDMIASDTIDETIVTVLRNKRNIADVITGDDPLDSWL